MKRSIIILSMSLLAAAPSFGQRAENTVILDSVSVQNLGIETVTLERTTFQDTIFALGRIEALPQNRAVVSTRIAGRVTRLHAFPGERVTAGAVVAEIESRQPGFPPPTVQLTATIDGMIAQSHVQLGEPVEPSSELMDIVNLDQLYAIASVPEIQAARLSENAEAKIRIPAVPGFEADARLVRFGVMASRENGSVDAYFNIENLDGAIRPGMRAEFHIEIGSRENVASLPASAIQGDRANPIVFIRDFELPNAFVKSPVTLGARNGDRVEILSGVFQGDEIVTRGAYALGFVGGGGISLKEALDAAHGHEHNEDGSELTAAQKAAREREKRDAAGGATGSGPWVLFLGTLCVVQFVLLLLAQFRLRAKPAQPGGGDA